MLRSQQVTVQTNGHVRAIKIVSLPISVFYEEVTMAYGGGVVLIPLPLNTFW